MSFVFWWRTTVQNTQNLTAFLQDILPPTGPYFAARQPNGGNWADIGQATLDDLVSAIEHYDSRGHETYFALGAYNDTSTRKADNVRELRALWVDIDVGESKGYATRKEALLDFKRLFGPDQQSQLPNPTHIVSSGYGFHVYWAFHKPLPVAVWTPLAALFKSLCIEIGLRIDPVATKDAARVLRPIDTRNHKDPGNPRPVTLLYGHAAKPLDPRTVYTHLKTLAKAQGLDTTKAANTSRKPEKGAGGAFAAFPEYGPSNAQRIAEQCPTIQHFRDTKGADMAYHPWWDILTVLGNTVDGLEDDRKLIHDWCSEHETYTPDVVDTKVDEIVNKELQPATCLTIADTSPHCQNCKYRDRLGGPIQLGRQQSPHQTTTPEETGGRAIGQLPPVFDGKFWWDGERLWGNRYKLVDGNWQATPHAFCSTYFEIDFLFRDERDDNKLYARISALCRDQWSQTDVPMSAIGRGGNALEAEIGGYLGIVSVNHSDLLVKYVKTWVDHVLHATDRTMVRRSMGWQEDGSFLLGNKLYRPDGTVTDAVISRELQPFVEAHRPRGDLALYTKSIDRLYNRPGRESHQLMWLASFASPLVALYDTQPQGLILTATSAKPGTGKTSAALAGLSVWADPHSNGQNISADGATEYAFYRVAGDRRHLAMLFDETTTWSSERIIRFAYRYSQGVARMQGRADGSLKDNSHLNWQNIMYMTSNTAPSARIIAGSGNAAPMLARMFEVPFKYIDFKGEDQYSRDILMEMLRSHSGVAGDKFIRHLVRIDKEKIRTAIQSLIAKIETDLDIDSAGRFWVRIGAFLMLAAKLTKTLGLHDFHLGKLKVTIYDCIRHMQASVEDSVEDAYETLSALLSDVSSGMIITQTSGSNQNPASSIMDANLRAPLPRGDITGRIVMEGTSSGVYIPAGIVRKWCDANNKDYNSFVEALTKLKILKSTSARYNLAWGTVLAGGRPRSWKLNYNLIQEQADDIVLAERAAGEYADDGAAGVRGNDAFRLPDALVDARTH